MKVNKELSEKYKGLTIYDSENAQFPYYVQEWDECFTEEEIKLHWNESLDFANIDTEQEREADAMSLIDAACDALYSGDDDEAFRLMALAKQVHLSNGGGRDNWPGLTDDRSIHEDYPYDSL